MLHFSLYYLNREPGISPVVFDTDCSNINKPINKKFVVTNGDVLLSGRPKKEMFGGSVQGLCYTHLNVESA